MWIWPASDKGLKQLDANSSDLDDFGSLQEEINGEAIQPVRYN